MSPSNKSGSCSVAWTELDGEYAYAFDMGGIGIDQINTQSGVPVVLNDIDPYNMSGHDALGQIGCARIVTRGKATYAKLTMWKHVSARRLSELRARLVPVASCGIIDGVVTDYRFLYIKIEL